MRGSRTSVALLGALSLTLIAWTVNDVRDTTRKITLTGDAVIPNKVTTGATGVAVLTWDDHGGIAYTLTVKGLSSKPTGAHIHGPADKNSTAPALATMDIKDSLTTGEIAKGMIGASIFAHFQRDALKDLFEGGKAYIHIHTKDYPDGELRGQVKK